MIQSPGFPVSDRTRTLHLSQTDLVRFVVISAITLSIAGITYLSTAAGYGAIVPSSSISPSCILRISIPAVVFTLPVAVRLPILS